MGLKALEVSIRDTRLCLHRQHSSLIKVYLHHEIMGSASQRTMLVHTNFSCVSIFFWSTLHVNALIKS